MYAATKSLHATTRDSTCHSKDRRSCVPQLILVQPNKYINFFFKVMARKVFMGEGWRGGVGYIGFHGTMGQSR